MPQYNGVWTLQAQSQALTNQQWVTDPNFNNTTLLLQADNAANTAQNNTFLDSSTNSFAITRNGNTTQGSFTPFSPGWSNYFASAQITTPASSDFAFGSGDFTVECFVNSVIPSSGYNDFVGTAFTNIGTNWFFGTYNGKLVWSSYQTNIINGTTPVPSNTWVHTVVSRVSGTTRLFLNGVLDNSVADSTVYTNVSNLGIGSGGGTAMASGYISNLRIVKGSGVTSVTVPTAPLTPITNTVLLTCQSNRFIDTNTQVTAKALTVAGGTPSVQAFSPFAPQYQWTPSVIGGSGYFDGNTSTYLSVASNSAFTFGTGDFTLEFWLYPTSTTQRNITFPTVGACIFYMNTSKQLQFENYGATPSITTTNTLNLNSWNHCVASRVSGTTKLFINGVEGVSSAAFSATNFVQSSLNIGTDAGTTPCNGYMSGVRIVKGSGVTSVTVPTAPPTAITNTSLLLNYTNAGIYDGTMKNDLQTVGNAQVSTAVVKYGSGSMYFDGSGDGLYLKSAPLLAMGTGDFTVEFWMYSLANQASYTKYFCSGSAVGSLIIDQQATANTITVNNNSSVYLTSPAFSNNVWFHVAVVRFNGTINIYFNGVSVVSVANSTSFTADTVGSVGSYTDATKSFNGYMDDFRISKFARYLQNFTPPQVALPRQ